MSNMDYTNVNFYIPARGQDQADAKGYAHLSLRVPSDVLRIAFNSHVGSLPADHSKMLITDKPMLNLPVNLSPIMDRTIITHPSAKQMAHKLLPYHTPEPVKPVAQAASAPVERSPQSATRRPATGQSGGMGFGFAPARR